MRYILNIAGGILAVIVLVFMAGIFLVVPESPAQVLSTSDTRPSVTAGKTACETITLECLSSQPEWNPTPSATGIERIDPSELTLFGGGYELVRIPFNYSDNFVTVRRAAEFTQAACVQFPEYFTWLEADTREKITQGETVLVDPKNPMVGSTCPPYGPEAYTEVAILSADNNEVIHAFRLTDHYSFINTKGALLGGGLNWGDNTENSLSLYLSYWENFSDPIPQNYGYGPKSYWWLNLYTGELSTERPTSY